MKINPFSIVNNSVNSAQNVNNGRIFGMQSPKENAPNSCEKTEFNDIANEQKIKNFDRTIQLAKDSILNNIDKFNINDDYKALLKGRLNSFDTEKIPDNEKMKSITLSEAAFTLVFKTTQSSNLAMVICTNLINSDSRFKDFKIEGDNVPKLLQGKTVTEVAEVINNNSPQKIEQNFKKAQEQLITSLKSNPNRIFKNPYNENSQIKASDLIKYVENMKFREDRYGSAQAYDFSPEDGINERNGILVNTNVFCSSPYMSTAEMMKVLIHESLHCAFSKEHFPFNNQKEEMYCERQAIQMTSEILSSPDCKIEDAPSVYGKNFAEFGQMSEEELTEFLQSEFINKGYEHRPKDTDGNVNIMGHEIQKGDNVIINGQNVGEVGIGSNILDQLDEKQILMFGRGGGQVIFSNEKPDNAQTLTIERNGEPVMQAYIIPYRPQGQ